MAAELLKEETREEVPVAVIGGGIVGPVMAYILGEHGIRVHLYEARGKSLDGSQGRAINLSLSSRGMDALVRIGISEEVLKETTPFYGRCIHLPNSGGKTKLQYYSVKKEAVHSMNRRRLSELLLKKLEENPNVKIYYEHKLMNIEHQNNTLHFNVKRAGEEKESSYKISIKAKFIIGCDGFNSSVRKSVLGSILHYQQDILDEVYHELYLPPTQNGESALQHSDMFHIWPLGDAAHSVLPFYGQGMNAGLEDCLIFEECLQEKDGDLETAAELFTDRRWKDLHTLADQSLHNFTTLRKGVNSNRFWINIKLESLLSVLLPNVFKQIYPMVVFSRGRYSEIHEREKWQKKLVNMIAIIIIIMSMLIISLILSFVI
uniref:FAD-binding domain-containing protein n=1 Tax=Amphimedon queenslandica TaxID=400682 RepID=A0A1X7ULE0_AMPQE